MISFIRFLIFGLFLTISVQAMEEAGPRFEKGQDLITNIKNGNERMVAEQISNSVDVNIVDANEGMSALMWALFYGREKISNMLIAAKADVNYADDEGETALHIAAMRNSLEMCKQLVAVGANVNHAPRLFRFHVGHSDAATPLACAIQVIGADTDRQPICEFLVETKLGLDRAQKSSMHAFRESLWRNKHKIPAIFSKDIRQLLQASLYALMREQNSSKTLADIKKVPAGRKCQRERINNLLKKYFPNEPVLE